MLIVDATAWGTGAENSMGRYIPSRGVSPLQNSRRERQSGLTEACLESPYAHDTVRRAVLKYIKKWIPRQRAGVLAGSSVHADRVFLVQEMPEVVDWLHYRYVFRNASVCGRSMRGVSFL